MTTVSSNSQNIIPEWKYPKGLVLVYPKNLPDNRSDLTNCYKELIKSVLISTKLPELTLIVRPTAKTEIENYIRSLNSQTQIRFFETNAVQDIWARDFCPIYFSNGTVCQGLYNPSYFEQKHMKYADLDDQTGIELAKFLQLNIKYLPQSGKDNLILDGGNFIHNGQGTAIVTNRVIADNETFSIDRIKEIFKSQLNISNLIFIPVEPGDESGHIDGMIRFANEQTVFVASYPDKYEIGDNNISEAEYTIGKQFLEELADTLRKVFAVITIENAIPKDNTKFSSAFGNYINFLRIGNTFFLPQYGIKQDKKAEKKINEIKKYFTDLKIVKVEKDIDKLSKLGGVLNCISWTYY